MRMFSIHDPGFGGALDSLARLLGAPEDWQQAHLAGTGPVATLEAKLKAHYGMDYALCVANATLGLLAVGRALDLQHEDFVTTPYTYGSSFSGLMLLGNRPIFADIERETLTLDPDAARRAVTSKTRAILAVDIYGVPSDTKALRKVADETGCWYIADAAQSLGATRDGLPASALADAIVVSFTVGKTLFAGEGGAVLTNNRELYEKLVWHTQHPQRQGRELGLQLQNEFALNSRIHPFSALWASATFEESLQRLRARQDQCFQVIEALNQSGLTNPISFQEHDIQPSFFRLAASWRDEPQPAELMEYLDADLVRGLVSPPASLVYRQAAFQAMVGARYRRPPRCNVTETLSQRLFCVVTADPED